MTVDLKNIKGTPEEMEELFNVDHTLSVRYYERQHDKTYKITIRCNEEVEPKIKFKRTIKGILKIL